MMCTDGGLQLVSDLSVHIRDVKDNMVDLNESLCRHKQKTSK